MSDKAERERHCAELRAAVASMAGHQLARAESEEDFIAKAVAERPMMDEADEAELWERCGRTLRAADPVSYKLLVGVAMSLAALAVATPEN